MPQKETPDTLNVRLSRNLVEELRKGRKHGRKMSATVSESLTPLIGAKSTQRRRIAEAARRLTEMSGRGSPKPMERVRLNLYLGRSALTQLRRVALDESVPLWALIEAAMQLASSSVEWTRTARRPASRGTAKRPRLAASPLDESRAQAGAYLRGCREATGLSRRGTSEQAGLRGTPISVSQLVRVEEGRQVPRVDLVATLAELYGVSIASLTEPYRVLQGPGWAPQESDPEALRKLGMKAHEAGRVREASAYFQQGVMRATKQRETDPSSRAGRTQLRLRIALANTLIELCSYRHAEEVLRVALREERRFGDLRDIAQYTLAAIYKRRGELTLAEALAADIGDREGLSSRVRAGLASLLATVRYSRAQLAGEPERLALLERSRQHFQQAHDVLLELRRGRRLAMVERECLRVRSGQARCLIELGREAHGLDMHRSCVEVAESSGDIQMVALAHFDLGHSQWISGRKATARRHFERARAVAQETQQRSLLFHAAYYLWRDRRRHGTDDDTLGEVRRDLVESRRGLDELSKELRHYDEVLVQDLTR